MSSRLLYWCLAFHYIYFISINYALLCYGLNFISVFSVLLKYFCFGVNNNGFGLPLRIQTNWDYPTEFGFIRKRIIRLPIKRIEEEKILIFKIRFQLKGNRIRIFKIQIYSIPVNQAKYTHFWTNSKDILSC